MPELSSEVYALAQMPTGYFTVHQDVPNLDILYQVAQGAQGPCPDDQLALKNDLEAAEAALKVLYPDDKLRLPRFRELLSIAQVGLQDTAEPKIAASALANLKQAILTTEGSVRKNRYFKHLGFKAGVYAGPALLIAALLKYAVPVFSSVLNQNIVNLLITFLLLYGGAMVGAWLSYGLRTVTLTFDDLATPEEDRLEPDVRLVFVGVLTLVVGLALYLGLLEVQIGRISSQLLFHRASLALLVGVLMGASERALTGQVSKLVSTILSAKN
jgi:hypothetical protein